MGRKKASATKASADIRVLVAFSDIHAGSTVALFPPGFVTLEGNKIDQSPIQKWLWECWLRCNGWLDGILGDSPHAMVLNGDMIEGIHHRSKQVVSADTQDHVEAAIHILRDRCHRANKTFVVRGTECHTNNSEIVIGKALKLEVNPETELPAWDRLTLDMCGVRAVYRHHIGTSTRRSLGGTQLSLTLAEEQLEASNNGEPIPRIVVCSHRHKYGFYQDEHGMCVVSPPWQALTRFGHKVVPAARTKPGIVVLDWRDREDGELPVLHRIICDAPRPVAITP